MSSGRGQQQRGGGRGGGRGGHEGGGRGRGHEGGGRGGHEGGGRGGGRGGYEGGRGGRGGGRGAFSRPESAASTTIAPSSSAVPPSSSGGRAITFQTVAANSLPSANATFPTNVVSALPGKAGTQIALISNYYPVKIPAKPFFQYDVKFTPEIDNPRVANFILKKASEGESNPLHNKIFVFDGNAMLFTNQELDKAKEKKLEFIHKHDNVLYKVVLAFATTLSSSNVNQAVFQLFNLVHRRAYRYLSLNRIGRNFYNLKQAIEVKQHNLKILPGLLSTLYMSQKGLFLNAEVIYKSLRTDSILSLINEYKSYYGSEYQSYVEDVLVGKIAMCNYNGKTFFIDGIAWDKNPKSKFEKSGQMITFADYYKKHHNLNLRDVNQPLLICERKKAQKTDLYVPELCSLTGLTEEMRQNFNLMKDMKAITGLNPGDRLKQIAKSMQENLSNKQFVEEHMNFEYEIDNRMLELNGRVIPKEAILFGKGASQFPDEQSAWNIRNALYAPVPISNWIVVHPPGYDEDIDNFLRVLRKTAKDFDVNVANPKICVTKGNRERDYMDCIKENAVGTVQFVFIALDKRDSKIYNSIKQYLCIDRPTISQCALFKTIGSQSKGLPSKVNKIAIQIVAKLGGAPWSLKFVFPGPTMICGVDVYHSGEVGKKTKASIVGFNATMNNQLTKYYSRLQKQKPGQELIEVMKQLMKDALTQFKAANNIFPAYVIFYRDGVGEGQVDQVKLTEVDAILKAFKEVGTEAKLTFTVVLKRINTRLFSKAGSDYANPAPGTVVDSDITHSGLDFFLVSQYATQGSVTPTRYQTIHNDAKFGADYLQSLAFKLTHMYFNWNGTIKSPALCQNAHKAAFLAGQSIPGVEDPKARLANHLYFL